MGISHYSEFQAESLNDGSREAQFGPRCRVCVKLSQQTCFFQLALSFSTSCRCGCGFCGSVLRVLWTCKQTKTLGLIGDKLRLSNQFPFVSRASVSKAVASQSSSATERDTIISSVLTGNSVVKVNSICHLTQSDKCFS